MKTPKLLIAKNYTTNTVIIHHIVWKFKIKMYEKKYSSVLEMEDSFWKLATALHLCDSV